MATTRLDGVTSERVPPSVWNPANALTVFRILLVPLFVSWLMLDGGQQGWMRIAAAVVFWVAVATDRLDGDIARRRGLVTDFGKIADPIADKALMGAALICLSLLGELWWWVTAVILVREIGITVLRLAVLRHMVVPASRGGKYKTALQALAVGLFLLPLDHWLNPWLAWFAWAVMAAAVVSTVWTGAAYVIAIGRQLRAERAAGPVER